MITCPKCFKQSPDDAAFCGYCGASLVEQQVKMPEGAKTVFGYAMDPLPKAPAAMSEPEPDPAATIPDGHLHASALKDTLPSTPVPEIVGGKYRLGVELERLPVGVIYLARNEQSGQDAALLLVKDEVFPSPLDMERTRRELHQLAKVDCPNILKVAYYGKSDGGQLYVVMDHLAIRSLDQLISAGPMDLANVQYLVKGIGNALAEAQKIGVYHRDIAPHNVVLDSNGVVKVRGFGVAPALKAKIFGSPEYISPEQIQGRPVDQRANIYSLGALMFYMLTGVPPFTDPDLETLFKKHQKDPVNTIKSCRPGFDFSEKGEALLQKALAKTSSRRHLTLRQFLREVELLTEGLPETDIESQATLKMRVLSGAKPVMAPTPSPAPSIEADADDLKQTQPGHRAEQEAPASLPSEPSMDAPTPALEPMPAPTLASPIQPVVEPLPIAETVPASAVISEPMPQPTVPEPVAGAPAAEAVLAHPATPAQEAKKPRLEEVKEPVSGKKAGKTSKSEKMDKSAAKAQKTDKADKVDATAKAEKIEKTDNEEKEVGKDTASRKGELSSAGALKKPEKAQISPEELKARETRAKEAMAGAGKAEGGGSPGGRKGFRETLWFVKGEAESEAAATPPKEGEEGAAEPPVVEPSAVELAKKYEDDGSIGAEGAHHLSLRTGKTQQMRALDLPSGEVPGEKMDADDFLNEMNSGRKILIIIGAIIALAVVGTVIYFLVSG